MAWAADRGAYPGNVETLSGGDLRAIVAEAVPAVKHRVSSRPGR